MPRLLLPYLVAASALLLITGCSTPAIFLYKLTPAETGTSAPPTSGSSGSGRSGGLGLGIGVGPVTIADYLSRPNLIMQEGANKLTPAESHRWAGDLDDNIARVTAANLGQQLRTSHVLTYPWGSGDEGLKYQITLDIRELHGHADGHAILDAAWRIYALPARTIVTSRTWTATEPLTTDGYESLVAAESRLLARLAQQIQSSLK